MRNYPTFSWDSVPLYMHVRKATAFTDDEIEYLARFPLIAFEKATGHKSYGTVEEGTLRAARAVKRINPEAKILYYRNVLVHYGGYGADEALAGIPGRFLVGRNGNTKLVRKRVPAYDLSDPQLRQWWVEACRTVAADPAIDGLFIDGNIKALEPGYLRRDIGERKKRAVLDGYREMMKETRDAIGPGKLMLANIVRARFAKSGLEYLHYFDGSYLEGFEHAVSGLSREEYMAKGIDAAQTAARQGYVIALTLGLGEAAKSEMGIDDTRKRLAENSEVRERLTYCLAIFLVCAEKHSYFYAHDGYDAVRSKTWLTRFPEYDRPLGPPKGPARRDGYVYTRQFEHLDVWVDIEAERARLSWH